MIIPPQVVLYASQIWVKAVAVAVISLGLLFSGYHLGAKVTKADWEHERAVHAEQQAAAEKVARTEEQRRVKEAQAVVDGSIEREAASRVRAARAERTVVSLRNDIARLNGRSAPGNAEAASYANEARVARELLGSCAKEYQELAVTTDQYRNQVTGLQQWVSHVAQ